MGWVGVLTERRRPLPLVATLLLALVVGGAGLVSPGGTARAADDPTPTPTPSATPTPTPTPGPAIPTATTADAAGVTATAVTLGGSVDTGGVDASYRFEYGTTTGYGLTTASVAVPAATSPVWASSVLSGLTAGTTYHFRLVATNAAGSGVGADHTFTTASAPHKPAVAVRAADPITATAATFVGRVNPYGLPTTYAFEWGTSTTTYGQSTPQASVAVGPTATVTAQVTGLQPNTRYVYRVVATNAAGTVKSSARSLTTGRGITSVSLTAVRRTLDWDGVTVISGAVKGAVPGGTKVLLMRQEHPFTGTYKQVGSQTTSSAGTYSFSISRLFKAEHYRVIADTTPQVSSGTLTLNTRLLTRLTQGARTKTSVRLTGVVYPAVAATTVRLQRASTSGRWITVKRPKLTRSSSGRATFKLRVSRSKSRSQRYRLIATPNDGGAHVTTTGKSVTVPKR